MGYFVIKKTGSTMSKRHTMICEGSLLDPKTLLVVRIRAALCYKDRAVYDVRAHTVTGDDSPKHCEALLV